MISGIYPDPELQDQLSGELRKVCSTVTASDPVTREELIAISNDPKKNPLGVMSKQEQSQTNTCAAHSGTSGLECHHWARTGMMVQRSRLWLYCAAKISRPQDSGRSPRFVDDGVSIPSVVDVLRKQGCPLEVRYHWNPNQSQWPSVSQFRTTLEDASLNADAALCKLPDVTEISPDFDVAVARVLKGRDPLYWGTGWGFPNGPAGHATLAIWARWDGRRRDWVLIVWNSHAGNYTFECSRDQYSWIVRHNTFGAYHFSGAVDLRITDATELF